VTRARLETCMPNFENKGGGTHTCEKKLDVHWKKEMRTDVTLLWMATCYLHVPCHEQVLEL
jgi:hypothetical protein